MKTLRISSLAGYALFLFVALAAAASEDGPRLTLDETERLTISDLPRILGENQIKRHLDSGLTTSFLFQAKAQGWEKEASARVDIRLELWDEEYLVTVFDGEGRLQNLIQESAEALSKWWSGVHIVLSAPAGLPGRADSDAKVSLAVVPFSQAELVDTQKWLTESIGQAQSGARAGAGGGASRTVGALIATSMQRRSVRSMTWSVPVERGSAQ